MKKLISITNLIWDIDDDYIAQWNQNDDFEWDYNSIKESMNLPDSTILELDEINDEIIINSIIDKYEVFPLTFNTQILTISNN